MNDIFNSKIFILNDIEDYQTHFPTYVRKYLDSYINVLKQNSISEHVVNRIEKYRNNIYACLLEYYCGQRGSSRFYFCEAMKYINISDAYTTLKEELLYRARKGSDIVFSKEEMFHIPLEKRFLVTTQRYSFPGTPCLYMGSSYEVCCEELEDWSSNVNIARIKPMDYENIRIFDLGFWDDSDIKNLNNEDLSKFLNFWPLVACCSFSYKNTKKMEFRPDYVIPQLLFEYIMDLWVETSINGTEEIACGLRYYSVKKDYFNKWITENTFEKKYINYVFPAVSDEHSGLCAYLTSLFKIETVFTLKEMTINRYI